MTASFSYPVGQAPATQTNDNAAAGKVGEIISANVALASAVSMTTGVAINVTSVNLPPGDWDVEGLAVFVCTATTSATGWAAAISSVSATEPTPPNITAPMGGGGMNETRTPAFVSGATELAQMPTGKVRVTLSATTTIFLVVFGNFTASTLKAYGVIVARRAR